VDEHQCFRNQGAHDAFDLNDGRVNAPLDPIPVFMAMQLNPSLLRPAASFHGASAPVQYRRALDSSVMLTTWSYVDHLLLPPGSSTKPHLHTEQAEFYYVMSGEGTVTVGIAGGRGGAPETAPIKVGDAIPINLSEVHSFSNTGSAPSNSWSWAPLATATRRMSRLQVRSVVDVETNLETSLSGNRGRPSPGWGAGRWPESF